MIIQQGNPGTTFYILFEGEVAVSIDAYFNGAGGAAHIEETVLWSDAHGLTFYYIAKKAGSRNSSIVDLFGIYNEQFANHLP